MLNVNGEVCGLEASGSHIVTVWEARHRMIQTRCFVISLSWVSLTESSLDSLPVNALSYFCCQCNLTSLFLPLGPRLSFLGSASNQVGLLKLWPILKLVILTGNSSTGCFLFTNQLLLNLKTVKNFRRHHLHSSSVSRTMVVFLPSGN